MSAMSAMRFLLSCLILIAIAITGCGETVTSSGPIEFKVTLVDGNASGSATHASNKQNIVSNSGGIFLTYIHHRLEQYEPTSKHYGDWRLLRSTDGGETFQIIYEARHGTLAPAVETDEQGNIYLAHPDWNDVTDGGLPLGPNTPFLFYRFAAVDDYKNPQITRIPNVPCAAKFSMAYDPARQQFYIATQYGQLLTVGVDGQLKSSQKVWKQIGPNAYTQYPHLMVDESGTLHWSYATCPDYFLFYSVQYIKSTDGGRTWQHPAGKVLETPIIPDDTGPSEMVSLDSEYWGHTFLANMLTLRGKVHFFYGYRELPPGKPQMLMRS